MDKGFWNRFAFAYDLATRSGDAGLSQAARYVASFLPADGRVLDAACGTGAFACAVAPQVREVVATDYAEGMVTRARDKARRLGLANVSCSQADLTCLPFADRSFDAAIAGNVLHLLDDPQVGVDELCRVVRPGGVVALPNYVNGDDPDNPFLRLIGAVGFSAKNEWREAEFLDFIRGSGLELVESRSFTAKQPLCVAICRTRA